MSHPFADLLAIHIEEQQAGFSRLSLSVSQDHLNPHQVVHGAVLYALADTGMGAALYPTLVAPQICATIEIKINYFKAVREGRIECVTELVHRGKSVANLQSKIFAEEKLIASANGNYAIFLARSTS